MADEKYFKQRFDAMLNVIWNYTFYFYEKLSQFYNYKFELAVFILEGYNLTVLYDNKNLKNLGKCIINRILKDGDSVEVNADKGVVKILKHQK